MLFAGVDHSGPHLFHLDPSGTYIKCLAKAIGAGGDGAEQVLREQCANCDKVFLGII
jgi:20S proteasome alpha/beta subunit